jgi:predicted glutamine amidotransferase
VCRLLGVVASRPAPLDKLLIDELGPFLQLACEHADGWGISYLEPSGDVVTVKEPVSAFRSTTFRELVKRIVTDAAILHLRMASAGLPLTKANTHPFGDSQYAFAHNGAFSPVSALDETLVPGFAAPAGDTDSERYYLAVRQGLDSGFGPVAAIASAAADIGILATEWESLNCLLLTPQGLYAYAESSPDSKVLKRRGPAFFDLRYRADPGRAVVASTGWVSPANGWRFLTKGTVLEISRDLQLAVR